MTGVVIVAGPYCESPGKTVMMSQVPAPTGVSVGGYEAFFVIVATAELLEENDKRPYLAVVSGKFVVKVNGWLIDSG